MISSNHVIIGVVRSSLFALLAVAGFKFKKKNEGFKFSPKISGIRSGLN